VVRPSGKERGSGATDGDSIGVDLLQLRDAKLVRKGWGDERWLVHEGAPFAFKVIRLEAGQRTSLQLHRRKHEANPAAEAVLIEDFHLMLVGNLVRERAPAFEAPIAYFHHVPWCAPEYFSLLPDRLREEILQSLLAYDAIGFHCSRWAEAFIECCERFLDSCSRTASGLSWREREVRVVASPAPLDVASARARAGSEAALQARDAFETAREGRLAVVRVDRVDLWKNVLRGFQSFRLTLQTEPAWAESIWFLAVLSKTRSWIPEYRDYLEACRKTADDLNRDYRRAGRELVTMLVANEGQANADQAIAALSLADVVLVNPTFDGLNLVAKEAVAVGEQRPGLALSVNAGVAEEFRSWATLFNPFDLVATADAIATCARFSPAERASRAAAMLEILEARTTDTWLSDRLQGLTTA
jgi:trehalose 6-phosphate synthase